MRDGCGGEWILKCSFGSKDSKLNPKYKSSTSYSSRPLHFCGSTCKMSIYLLEDKNSFILITLSQPITNTISQAPAPHTDPVQATPLSSKPQNRGCCAQEACKHPFLEQLPERSWRLG